MQSIGDRIRENYEYRDRRYLARRTPVIIRVDGRAFHTLTKSLARPFDECFEEAMLAGALALSKDMTGFKVAYVQSDEASFLLTDYDTHQTEAWFDYNQSKLESISASIMTAFFNQRLKILPLGCFDARAFNIPREEVVNYFLWRTMDCSRNSLSMYARSQFTSKELMNKNQEAMHEMLHKIGRPWMDHTTPRQRNGTLFLSDTEKFTYGKFTYAKLEKLLKPLIYPEGA